MPTRSPHEEPPGPAAPAIPTFESLRSTRRRSAVDVLLPGAAPESPQAAVPPPAPAVPPPAPSPAPAPAAAARPGPGPAAPRPAEYGDLLRLGLRAVRAGAGVPLWVLGRLRAAVRR